MKSQTRQVMKRPLAAMTNDFRDASPVLDSNHISKKHFKRANLNAGSKSHQNSIVHLHPRASLNDMQQDGSKTVEQQQSKLRVGD